MMKPEEDMQAHALRKQGPTIAAIARHLGRDRKTVRAYLEGARQPGVRTPAGPDPFDVIADYGLYATRWGRRLGSFAAG